MNLLDVMTRKEWRKWLSKHHDSEREVWLVFHKHGEPSIDYEDSVEEALCFGWIDSIIKRLDDDRYARKFTPRKPESKWSDLNVRRYERVKAAGLLAPAGKKLAPTPNRYAQPPMNETTGELEKALRANPRARENFEKLAPSYRRIYVLWIATAKREETKQKRIAEALEKLERGEKLGLK